MMGLIENLETKHNIQVQYLHCDHAGENVDFKKVCKQEGMGMVQVYSLRYSPTEWLC